MHPILSQLRRVALYLLAWIPIGAILLYLMASQGGMEWTRALALVIPLCVIYAFVCLSAWYSCRYTPLERASFSRMVLTHLIAAIVLSSVWVLMARGVAMALATMDAFHGLDHEMARDYPLLLGSGILLYLLAVALHYVLLSEETSREAEKQVMQARVLARDSELKALKAQVNPHFIFNSLNSISALTTADAAKAREMCVLLGDFLRKTLGLGEKAEIPLGEELALIRSFLSVEKIRFGPRISFEENTQPQALDCMVPPLLLQPLVENAISHGISNLTEGGWIRLDIHYREKAEDLWIRIENNFDPDSPRRRGAGMGLKNVRQRLAASYGTRASVDVRAEADHFTVTMELPAVKMAASA